MEDCFNILIVDDHPIIIEGYTNILTQCLKEDSVRFFNIESATSIDEAVTLINNNIPQNKFNLILLDISFPDSNTSKMRSGEDLGLFIKSKIPDAKIIAITALNDNFRLLNIIKKLNPEGLIVKSEVDGKTLMLAMHDVFNEHNYYSHSIVELLKKGVFQSEVLDDMDIQLLVELSNGAKMKELEQLLPLTKSGIDKRRRLLKEKLKIQSNSDRDLVLKAKEKGFI